MADNRMHLLHVPTGNSVLLGKQLFSGWRHPRPEELARSIPALFNSSVEAEWDSEYVVVFENADGSFGELVNWRYGGGPRDENGIMDLEVLDD